MMRLFKTETPGPLTLELVTVYQSRTDTIELDARSKRSWGGVYWYAVPVNVAQMVIVHSMQMILETEFTKMRNDYIRAMRALQGTRYGRHL